MSSVLSRSPSKSKMKARSCEKLDLGSVLVRELQEIVTRGL
jgi:hypothetical protein